MALSSNFTFVKPNFGTDPRVFFRETAEELKRVIWPKREEVIKLTAVVLGVSLVVAVYLGGLDIAFGKLVEIILARK